MRSRKAETDGAATHYRYITLATHHMDSAAHQSHLRGRLGRPLGGTSRRKSLKDRCQRWRYEARLSTSRDEKKTAWNGRDAYFLVQLIGNCMQGITGWQIVRDFGAVACAEQRQLELEFIVPSARGKRGPKYKLNRVVPHSIQECVHIIWMIRW
jgi:hypothetical protein